jgi:SAM-dependent methyltransferase
VSDAADAKRSEWADFALDDFNFASFPPGTRVLDVGCGGGEQLRALRRAGLDVVGVEPGAHLVEQLSAEGFDVRRGVAEQLPVDDRSFDGLVCKVVLPYTDERRAIAEWGRVLRPGAQVRAAFHGAGYYLRYLRQGPGLALRVYATRSLVNTWWYAATGRRLPGFLGDTLYQSSRRLAAYYREHGFVVERAWPSPPYAGRPVFIYHELRYAGAPARA